MLKSTTELELVARCREGQALAWQALYEAYFPFVYRAARRLGTPPAEVEDVCQETFEVAFRKLGRFREGSFRAWLYRITANTASARHRKRRVRAAFRALLPARGEPESAPPMAQRRLEARDAEMLVGRILERMAPKKREVLALYELEGLSGEEIAARVGCKVETVWTRLHYARRDFERLARKLGVTP